MKAYINRLLVAFSIFVNVLLGGKSNQTFSATQYGRQKMGKWNIVWLIDTAFFWEEDHCLESWVKWKIIHSCIRRNSKVFKNF